MNTQNRRIGKSKLPLRDKTPKNTIGLAEALEAFRDRPDIFSDDPAESLDIAALQIGLALKRARLRKGWKQEQLESATGIGQSAISAIECGKGRDGPSFRVLNHLAEALDTKVVLQSLLPITPMQCRVVSETPSKLVFKEGYADAHQCWAMVSTLLAESALEQIRITIRTMLASLSEDHFLDDEAVCGLWQMGPESHAKLTAQKEILVVSTSNDSDVLHIDRGPVLSGINYIIAKGGIEVSNRRANPIGILTVPLTTKVADQGWKCENAVIG